MPARRQLTRVALALGLSPGYSEGIFRGLSSFCRPTRSWVFELCDPRSGLRALRSFAPDGVIVSGPDAALARALRALGCPVVNVGPTALAPDFPSVGNDDGALGEMAARHFRDRGFTSFGFVSPVPAPFSELRLAGFQRVLPPDASCAVLIAPWRRKGKGRPVSRGALRNWLRALPRPAGVMALNDRVGWEVAEACRSCGLRVPEDVALVGTDDVEVLCRLALPPLSSVAVAAERIGFETGRLLESLMSGAPPPPGPLLFPPVGVVVRQSSDLYAVEDSHVAAALRFIADHAQRPIQVTDVLRAVPVARRTLEVKARRYLGRSLHDEIRRVRLLRARHLLGTTDWAMPLVAESSGFTDAKQLATVFREQVGTTPLAFRRRYRTGP